MGISFQKTALLFLHSIATRVCMGRTFYDNFTRNPNPQKSALSQWIQPSHLCSWLLSPMLAFLFCLSCPCPCRHPCLYLYPFHPFHPCPCLQGCLQLVRN